jgi:hypothetical protein
LRKAEQRGQHLAGLVVVVVDRLLAQDDEIGLFLVDQGPQQLGDRKRLQRFGVFDEDPAVRADGHRGPQRLLAGRAPAGDRHHLGQHALLLQPRGLFDGDLVEGVHAHLDVGQVHARAVGLHAYLHVEVRDSLHRDQRLHSQCLPFSWGSVTRAR